MKVLTKYVLKETLNPLAIGVFSFTLLFLAQVIFKLTDWMIIGGLSGKMVGTLFLSFLPQIMNITFPMALLLGCVFAFGRLSENNEVQAMLTCGQTYGKIIRPVIILGVSCTVFLLLWCEFITPRASTIQNMTMFKIIEKISPIAVLEEGKFSTRLPGQVVYPQRIDLAEKKIDGMAIFNMQDNKIRMAILSAEGKIDYDPVNMILKLDLKDGEIHANVETGVPDYVAINGSIQMIVDCEKMLAKLMKEKSILSGMSRGSLLKEREKLLKIEEPDKYAEKALERIETELSDRIVMPFACIVLAAIGAPLGFMIQRGSRGACFALSIGVIMVYYFLLVFGSSLAERDLVSLQVGAWTPNVIIGTLGLLVNVNLARK